MRTSRHLLLSVAATTLAQTIPEQFHTAIAGPDSLYISFKLNASAPQTCHYGLSPTALLNSTLPTQVRSYFPNGGYFHHALFPSLQPSTKFYYSCASSPILFFVSPPPPSQSDFTIAAFGDWGYLGSKERGPSIPVGGLEMNWSATLVYDLLQSWVNNSEIDFILLSGDISYSDDSFGVLGNLLKFTYETVQDAWFRWIALLNAVPFMVSVGSEFFTSPPPRSSPLALNPPSALQTTSLRTTRLLPCWTPP
jgi:Purple acid Phosphatase, N-terminal domain